MSLLHVETRREQVKRSRPLFLKKSLVAGDKS